MERVKKWVSAVDHLAPFLDGETTEGLVLTSDGDGIDMSNDDDS